MIEFRILPEQDIDTGHKTRNLRLSINQGSQFISIQVCTLNYKWFTIDNLRYRDSVVAFYILTLFLFIKFILQCSVVGVVLGLRAKTGISDVGR